MARRNPMEEKKKLYFDYLKIKNFRPLFIYHECIRCGDEFCREPMYQCVEPNVNFSYNSYYTGCTHCFSSKEDFKKYLEDRDYIYTEENFYSKNGFHLSCKNGDIDN